MERSKNDVWVGLFVLLGVLALVFLALKSANLLSFQWATTYQVTAPFDNIGGLKPKAPVKSSGVVVGHVDAIRFDDKSYQARVMLRMDQRYAFPKDSTLKILTSGLLGEQFSSGLHALNIVARTPAEDAAATAAAAAGKPS